VICDQINEINASISLLNWTKLSSLCKVTEDTVYFSPRYDL